MPWGNCSWQLYEKQQHRFQEYGAQTVNYNESDSRDRRRSIRARGGQTVNYNGCDKSECERERGRRSIRAYGGQTVNGSNVDHGSDGVETVNKAQLQVHC